MSVGERDGAPKRHNDSFTDESNDVIFVEQPSAKKPQTSFKNLFTREIHDTDTSAKSSPPPETHDTDKEKQSKDNSIKAKIDINAIAKRTDWDMFAEQDIDSNFDVSLALKKGKNLFHFVISIVCLLINYRVRAQ